MAIEIGDLIAFFVVVVFFLLGLSFIVFSKRLAEWNLKMDKSALKKGKKKYFRLLNILALIFISLGVVDFFITEDKLNSIWLLLVGIFLLFGRKEEYSGTKEAVKNKEKYIKKNRTMFIILGLLFIGLMLFFLAMDFFGIVF